MYTVACILVCTGLARVYTAKNCTRCYSMLLQLLRLNNVTTRLSLLNNVVNKRKLLIEQACSLLLSLLPNLVNKLYCIDGYPTLLTSCIVTVLMVS